MSNANSPALNNYKQQNDGRRNENIEPRKGRDLTRKCLIEKQTDIQAVIHQPWSELRPWENDSNDTENQVQQFHWVLRVRSNTELSS